MDALILFGPPGSGKGTQAAELVDRYKYAHIATGDLFREALAKGAPVALQAQDLMKAGKLVPDELVGQLLEKKLDQLSEEGKVKGIVFDGFPRNVAQVGMLDDILASRGIDLLGVVALDVEDDLLIKRLAGRRSCPACGRGFNLYFNPPQEAGRCDYDHAELAQRPDDVEETIRARLDVYRDQTSAVMEVYRGRGDLQAVDGNQGADAVLGRITQIVDTWARGR